jgi:hypothetical protein
MKKLALAVAALLLVLPGAASAQEEYLELLRQDIVTQKTALLTDAMALDASQSEKFWPIVREYDVERAKLADRRIALIKKYAANYETMTPDMAKDIADESMKIDGDMLKLKKDYFGKVSKALSPVEATRFLQVESFVDNLLRLQTQYELPLIQHGVQSVPHRGAEHGAVRADRAARSGGGPAWTAPSHVRDRAQSRSRLRSTNPTFAGRSARRRMYHGNQCRP